MRGHDLFLARTDECRRFSESLVQTRDEGGFEGWPSVVLVHGLGGIGKSSLLRRFRELTGEHDAVAWVDFEEERRSQPASFGGDFGPGLLTVLDVIMRECLDALAAHNDRSLAERAFAEYRTDVVKLPKLRDQTRAALAESAQSGVTKEEIAALEKTLLATGTLLAHQAVGLPLALGAASAIGTAAVSGPGIRRWFSREPKVAAADYELISDPHRTLARVFGAGVAELSQLRPLVVFLDTSEIVLGQMPWLREVMRASGDRVLWVVAARLEPESTADADSEVAAFVRQVPNDRLRLMALTRFDDETVHRFLQNRLSGRLFEETEVAQVAGFTKGLPLAVSLVADLLYRGVPLDQACASVERPHDALAPVTAAETVSALARRFLVHTERLTSDRAKQDLHRILCLAIANGNPTRNPGVLRALWNTQDDLFDSLRELATRHDFVLSGTFRLHDDVRDALRIDLLEPVRRTRIQESCRRAVEAVAVELRRQRELMPTLDSQLASEKYQALLLDYVWYSFWMRPEAGWQSAMSLLPLLAVANEQSAGSLLRQVEWFAEHGSADETTLFSELAVERSYSILDEWLAKKRPDVSLNPGRFEARMTHGSLERLSRLKPVEGLLGTPTDRDAALEVLRTRLLLTEKPNASQLGDAIGRLQQLAGAADPALTVPIATVLMSLARAGTEPDKSPEDVKIAAAAAIAADNLTHQAAWDLGQVASALHEHNDASLTDTTHDLYRRALDAEPKRAVTLGNYALFLTDVRHDHDAAEAMYRRALDAEPKRANTLGNYAVFLQNVRHDHDAAEAMYRRALDADPNHANNLGDYAVFLKNVRHDHDAAEAMYRRALDADPKRANTLGNYALFLKNVRHDHDAAEAMYLRALDAEPNHANTLGNYAVFLQNVRHDHDAAEAMYLRALDAEPNHANNLGDYAVFLQNVRHDHDAAEAMYLRALDAEPNHAINLGNYAQLHFIRGRDGEGERLARQALGYASDSEDQLRAECNFYLFIHVPAARKEAGGALQDLLDHNVSTAEWDFSDNLARVRGAADPRYPLLVAVAEALRIGHIGPLAGFPDWRDG